MELEGEIEDIIYQNEINSYTIARLETADEEITIVGYLPFVSKGDTIKVTGNYVEHKEYGEQFKVITFEKLMPRTASAIQKYLANANIKGIRDTRKKEKGKTHVDFVNDMKEGTTHE